MHGPLIDPENNRPAPGEASFPGMRPGKAARAELIGLLLVLAAAVPLRLGDFDEPWSQRGWQHLNALFTTMGRNYVEQGYLATRLAPATDGVPPEDGQWHLFMHHPPLFPLMLSMSFRIFGVHEWSARLLSVMGSLLALLAIWALTRRLFGRRAALAAAAFTAAVPATAHYGSHVCEMGPVLVGFCAFAFALHLRYLERPSRLLLTGLLLALFAAGENDWPGFYMMGAIALHFLWLRRWREVLWITGLASAVLVLHVLHVKWATESFGGGRGGSLVEAFNTRSWGGLEKYGGPAVALPMIGRHILRIYLWPVVALALIGLFRIPKAARPPAVLALILAGTADTLVFVEGAARHEFWIVTMAPALLALAGAGAAWLSGLVPLRKGADALLLLGILAVAAMGAVETHERFEDIESRFFHTLGMLIEARTDPGTIVGTCEFQADPLVYYARRRLKCFWQDALIPPEGLPPSLAPVSKVFIPEKKFFPHGHEKILGLLRAEYPQEVIETDACGKVFVFDVTRKLQDRNASKEDR